MSAEEPKTDDLPDQGLPENQTSTSADTELGQTRMEVAYGAGDGDDDAKAIVARKASMGVLYCLLYTSPSPRDRG